MSILVKETYECDFYDLMNRCWSGAIDTLEEIAKHDKEEEFMDYLWAVFIDDEEVDLTELNDFLWFDSDRIFSDLEIEYGVYEDEEEDEDEEDDEDDE